MFLLLFEYDEKESKVDTTLHLKKKSKIIKNFDVGVLKTLKTLKR